MLKVLYLVNFWGILPHNYFIKYLKEKHLAKVCVLVLPLAPHQTNGKVKVEAFFLDQDEKRVNYSISLPLNLSHFPQLLIHYFFNLLILAKFYYQQRHHKYDLLIGENSFNGMLVYFLKKLRLTNRTIFVTLDVLPNSRKKEGKYLTNSFLNRIILSFQHFCCQFAYKNDLVWYINDKIRIQDNQQGLFPKQYLVSPGAIDPERVLRSQKISKHKNTLAYMGNLGESLGFDMAIKALAKVKENLRGFKFIVVGGNPYLVNYYSKIAEKYGVKKNIKFYGQVPDFDEAIDIIAKCQIGLALYKPGSTSKYTDVSKVKNYLQALLPTIIIKPGPDIIEDLETYQAGVAVKFLSKDVALTIIKILKNEKRYRELSKGTMMLAAKFDYHILCQKAYKEIINKLQHIKN